MHLKSFGLVGALLLCSLSVEARVVYLTPDGAGTKDGSSWANARKLSSADDFEAAYADAAVGATEESPNELWIRWGNYMIFNKEFLLQPNVIVRGGFNGDETSAEQADGVANPTIFFNNYHKWTDTWKSGDQTWPIWEQQEDGRAIYHDPPVEGDTELYADLDSMGASILFCREDDARLGRVEFHGLTFTKYWGSIVRVVGENDRPIVFRDCRFLYVGRLASTRCFLLQLTGTGLEMEDCEFSSVCSPIFVKTASNDSARRDVVLKRCRFFSTQACWNTLGVGCTVGGVGAMGNVTLRIQGCSFDRSIGNANGNNKEQAGTIVYNGCGELLLEDTVISRGYGTCSQGAGAVSFTSVGEGRLTVRRCRFERNCYAGGSSQHQNQGAAVSIRGELADGRVVNSLFEDSAFIGNYTAATASDARESSCVAFGSNCYEHNGYNRCAFLNCLFEGNKSLRSFASTNNTLIGQSWTQMPRVLLANCVFKDNVCGITTEDGVVYHQLFVCASDTPRYTFVNAIFENTKTTVCPWTENTANKFFQFAGSVSDAGVVYGSGSASFFRYAPLDANANAGLEAARLTNGVIVARRVDRTSRYRYRGGVSDLARHERLFLSA